MSRGERRRLARIVREAVARLDAAEVELVVSNALRPSLGTPVPECHRRRLAARVRVDRERTNLHVTQSFLEAAS